MKIDKIAPQLAGVPNSKRLGAEMAGVVEEIAGHLDEQAVLLTRAKMSGRAAEVKRMGNNISSYGDALANGEATLAMVQDIMARAKAFDGTVDTINREFESRNAGTPTSEFASVVPTFTEAFASFDMTDITTASSKDIAQVLVALSDRNRVIRNSLPRPAVKTFAMVQLPVVVILGRDFDPTAFKRAGFDVTKFEGYPVIENQIMLAVRHDYARDADLSTLEMAEEILDTIAKGTGQRMKLVDEEARVPRDSGRMFAYYWIVPDTYHSRLLGLISGFTDWSIAV